MVCRYKVQLLLQYDASILTAFCLAYSFARSYKKHNKKEQCLMALLF
ncbi:hypothetical protein VCRA2116E424_90101 [Vibrio crassostreae]|nr:hypothetical protein VCRA2113O411_90067 [Vibrio crassostreae]CAK2368656.1 hypothetical protein VCRA2116E424_90101 [Vibrio crassostreae]CAK3507608.1 hypothetical protein VCRA2123O445_70101 [Vibrio crassostreae]